MSIQIVIQLDKMVSEVGFPNEFEQIISSNSITKSLLKFYDHNSVVSGCTLLKFLNNYSHFIQTTEVWSSMEYQIFQLGMSPCDISRHFLSICFDVPSVFSSRLDNQPEIIEKTVKILETLDIVEIFNEIESHTDSYRMSSFSMVMLHFSTCQMIRDRICISIAMITLIVPRIVNSSQSEHLQELVKRLERLVKSLVSMYWLLTLRQTSSPELTDLQKSQLESLNFSEKRCPNSNGSNILCLRILKPVQNKVQVMHSHANRGWPSKMTEQMLTLITYLHPNSEMFSLYQICKYFLSYNMPLELINYLRFLQSSEPSGWWTGDESFVNMAMGLAYLLLNKPWKVVDCLTDAIYKNEIASSLIPAVIFSEEVTSSMTSLPILQASIILKFIDVMENMSNPESYLITMAELRTKVINESEYIHKKCIKSDMLIRQICSDVIECMVDNEFPKLNAIFIPLKRFTRSKVNLYSLSESYIYFKKNDIVSSSEIMSLLGFGNIFQSELNKYLKNCSNPQEMRANEIKFYFHRQKQFLQFFSEFPEVCNKCFCRFKEANINEKKRKLLNLKLTLYHDKPPIEFLHTWEIRFEEQWIKNQYFIEKTFKTSLKDVKGNSRFKIHEFSDVEEKAVIYEWNNRKSVESSRTLKSDPHPDKYNIMFAIITINTVRNSVHSLFPYYDLITIMGLTSEIWRRNSNITKSCLGKQITEANEIPVKCPQLLCNSIIMDIEIRSILSSEDFESYLLRYNESLKKNNPKYLQCQTPNCRSFYDYSTKPESFTCKNCEALNCVKCRAVHPKESCKQYQNKLKKDPNYIAMKNKRDKGEIMECPSCKTILQKTKGCNWIQCINCSLEICWILQIPRWGPKGRGDLSGGCKCGVDGKKCDPRCDSSCTPHMSDDEMFLFMLMILRDISPRN